MRQLITSWLLLCGVVFGQDAMPLPWKRELELSDSGSDVLVMQALLTRCPGVESIVATDGILWLFNPRRRRKLPGLNHAERKVSLTPKVLPRDFL